jgi:hypothetical protein
MRSAILTILLLLPAGVLAQNGGSMALAPARFELEMKPGTETTVVINLDYRSAEDATKPARIVATLNDWTITRDGRVQFFPANTQAGSASPWLIYSPGEAAVMPGAVHQIRVTVTVPRDATPGDHLAALIVEQRPESLRSAQNMRQMIIKYRMASVFYIKVANLTREGGLDDLLAEATPDGVTVTPVMKNAGNSVLRPTASLRVLDAEGKLVIALPESETMPLLAGIEMAKPVRIDGRLPAGAYTVKYRVDFQDGRPPVEGVTGLTVGGGPQVASLSLPSQKP